MSTSSDNDPPMMELVSRSPTRNRNQKQCIGMNDLLHNLLIEILHRLPLKSAKQCMLVSKLWYSLMSSPYFAHRFLEINRSSALVLSYEDNDGIPRTFVTKENGIIRSELFSFSFLPFEQMAVVEPVVWCQDLVLLCRIRRLRHVSDSVYYICNPLTRSWIELPLPPTPRFHRYQMNHGFVFQGTGSSFKYAVLKIQNREPDVTSYIKVQIFTSESGIWSEKMLTFGRQICGVPPHSDACISYRGMLFWIAASFVLIGVDPFSVDGCCRLIDLPPRSSDVFPNLGVCNGILRLYERNYDYGILHIRVWDLKDYENGEWHLEHDITFPILIESEHIDWFVDMHWIIALACDPKDGDIIYVLMGDSTIVSCNLRNKTLAVLCECDHILTDIPAKERGFDSAFVYEVPWPPTSIHTLPPQNRFHAVYL